MSNWSRTSDCLRTEPRRREYKKRSASWGESVCSPRFSTRAIALNDLGDARTVSHTSVAFDWDLSDFLRRSCRKRGRFGRDGSWGTLQFRIPLDCIHRLCRNSRTCSRASFSIHQIFAFSDSQGIRVSQAQPLPYTMRSI